MPDSVHAAVFLPLPQTTVHFWKDISVGPGKSVWSGVSDRLTAGIAIRLSLLIISGSRGFAHFWLPGWAVRRGLLGGRLHHRLHSNALPAPGGGTAARRWLFFKECSGIRREPG